MVKCVICGSEGAIFVCRRCRNHVCDNCYDLQRGVCGNCKGVPIRTRRPTLTDRTDLSQLLLHPVPLGIILILAGLTLMMIGSVLTVGTGEGFLIIFPLFLGQVEPTTGMLLFFFILAITMLFVFAPWIFGPKRVEHILRAAVGSQRERGKKNELIAEKDYYISIDVSDLVRKSIAISASKHEVRVQGKMENGDPFEKDFDFPEDVRIEMVEYEYSANYLILRIKATTTP